MGNSNGVIDVVHFKKEIMKNIFVLPTDQPSRLFKFANELHLDTIPKDYYKKYNIYITSDEEIISLDEINLLPLVNGKDIQTNMPNI